MVATKAADLLTLFMRVTTIIFACVTLLWAIGAAAAMASRADAENTRFFLAMLTFCGGVLALLEGLNRVEKVLKGILRHRKAKDELMLHVD